MRALVAEIERIAPEAGSWCSVTKAQTLAAMILALRPRVVVELGTWTGGSAIPMALALRYTGAGHLIAIDAWSTAASIAGQAGKHHVWWGAADHAQALATFRARIARHALGEIVQVVHERTEAVGVPRDIGILHVDGNHGEQAVRDVDRFARAVVPGGLLVLDDLDWAGGGVLRARDCARTLGFAERYPLDTGVVMQRVA